MGRYVFSGIVRPPARPGGPLLDLLEHLDGLALLEGHDRLLPARAAAGVDADPLGLAVEQHRAHLRDADAEDLLDRLADLDLVRLGVDVEQVLVLPLAELGALLGHQRLTDDAAWVPHRTNTSVSRDRPFCVSTSASAASRSCAFT